MCNRCWLLMLVFSLLCCLLTSGKYAVISATNSRDCHFSLIITSSINNCKIEWRVINIRFESQKKDSGQVWRLDTSTTQEEVPQILFYLSLTLLKGRHNFPASGKQVSMQETVMHEATVKSFGKSGNQQYPELKISVCPESIITKKCGGYSFISQKTWNRQLVVAKLRGVPSISIKYAFF